MSIGSEVSVLINNKLKKFFIKNLGTPDLHSHFRCRPLINFAIECKNPISNVLEIGCGSGMNIFALDRVFDNKNISYVGFDLNSIAINRACDVALKLHRENIKFYVDNQFSSRFDNKYDLVLMIDVLEHLDKPVDFLEKISKVLLPGGRLIISVPTPLYPIVFGREFHNQVGHLVDGYTLEQLSGILKKTGYEIESWEYNTGLIASVLCFGYYRIFRKIPSTMVRNGVGLVLSLARWIDVFNGPKTSSSLFVVAKKC